ncbi:MAG: hypothetical protein ABW000_23475, partial [Actinoplanes sp.]
MNVRTTGAVLAVTLGVLLSGCSSPDKDQGSADVASLVSVAPPKAATSSAAPVSEERPLIRTDTSSEEEERLYGVWTTCLEQNGAGKGVKRKMAADAAAAEPNTDPGLEGRYKKAEKKCASKEPEEVWERAKRLDPAYADKLRDWVTCIRSHGIDAWESDGFLTFESLPP